MLEKNDDCFDIMYEFLKFVMRTSIKNRTKDFKLGCEIREDEIIRNMLDNNMSLEDISKATDLTIDEIKKNYNVNNAC